MTDHPHRRSFVRAVALGAGAASLSSPAPLLADEPKKEAEKSEADARMELVLARFGKQLDADARKTIRSEIENAVHRAETLRKFPLDNGDGPYPVFVPYRAPLGEEASPAKTTPR